MSTKPKIQNHTPALSQVASQTGGLSSRSFLKVVLGTQPAGAQFDGPLSSLWPKSEVARPIEQPWVLALDNDQLWDPAIAVRVPVPTLRSWLALEDATDAEQYAIVEPLVEEFYEVDREGEPSRWQSCYREILAELDTAIGGAHLESWRDTMLKQEAWTTWFDLPKHVQDLFPITLVESGSSGHGFSYTQYKGTVDALNHDLAKAGVNIHVIEQERSLAPPKSA